MKVVSYSFFRNANSCYEQDNCGVAKGKFFVNYLPALIRAHHEVWKGWQLWIYHDDRVTTYPYWKAMVKMAEERLLNLIYFGPSTTLTGIGGMLERIKPVFDCEVEYLVMRDIDSLPMPRDKNMVEVGLIEENALAHSIGDSVSHSGMMGGTLSLNCKKFRTRFECYDLETLLHRADGMHINWNAHGGDQLFLNGYVAPNLCADWVIHSKKDYGTEICKKRFPVIPQQCDADRLFSHVGGCGDAERAAKFYDERYPNEAILKAEREAL